MYWLIKSEPSTYSWDQFVKDKKTSWTGVRNFQAANNLKSMKPHDKLFFYHSGEGKEIVGIAEVIGASYPDPTDATKKFVTVDVAPVKALKKPVTLAVMKSAPALKGMQLLKQSRLSVSAVSENEWKNILQLAD